MVNKNIKNLIDFDYCIFSSHKTGTQSVAETFKNNQFGTIRFHSTSNLNFSLDSFKEFIIKRNQERNKKLTIITNFRLPIERHVSSFFQWHGQGILRQNPDLKVEDTIISKLDIAELNKIFVSQLERQNLVGYKESIHEIFDIFQLNPSDLSEESSKHSFSARHELADIYFFRFDELFKDFTDILSSMLKIDLKNKTIRNLSSKKYFASKYIEFKKNLKIPSHVIEKTYRYRKDLIDLYYPCSYELLKEKDIKVYGY